MEIGEVLLILFVICLIGFVSWFLVMRYLTYVKNKYVLNKKNTLNLNKVPNKTRKYFEGVGVELSDFWMETDSESWSKNYYYRGFYKDYIIEVNARDVEVGYENAWMNQRNVRYCYSIYYPKAFEKTFIYVLNRSLLEKIFHRPLFLKKVKSFTDNSLLYTSDSRVGELFMKSKVVEMLIKVEDTFGNKIKLRVDNKRVCVRVGDTNIIDKAKLAMLVGLTDLIGRELGYLK